MEEKEANWLPASAGDVLPVMRMSQPHADVLDGEYKIPPIDRVG